MAGKFARSLKDHQETRSTKISEKVSERDILCVQIAALCHDLGKIVYN